MPVFLLAIVKNLIIGAVLAYLAYLLTPKQKVEEPEPQENDYSPSAVEGETIKELFGTMVVQVKTTAVFDRRVAAIRK